MLNFDLNTEPDDAGIVLGFQDDFQFIARIPEKQTEINGFVRDSEERSDFGIDLRLMEREPDIETSGSGSGSSSKRRRYSIEEKGKAKISDDNHLNLGEMEKEKEILIDIWSGIQTEPGSMNVDSVEHNFIDISVSSPDQEMKDLDLEEQRREQALLTGMEQASRRKADSIRHHEIARKYAQRIAHFDLEQDLMEFSSKKEKKILLKEVDEEVEDSQSPFSIAMEMIKKRNYTLSVRNKCAFQQEFKWVPSNNNKGCNVLKREVPSLLDLSLDAVAKNAEAIVSLELVPDALRHKLSQAVCDYRKMNAHFVDLLARGSPTDIRVKDCSCLIEQEFSKIFGGCDTKDLTLLQLDLCGHCMSDDVLHDTLARPSCSLPALVTISLRGAYRLSDIGLKSLAESAPALQSVNLSQCSLLTCKGIDTLASKLLTIRELYIDDCQNIDAMLILPALKKLKCLEVLSVAGIQTVCDDFVIGIVEECGINMKELVLANCVALTDISLQVVGKTCSRLCALDLSYLHNLTDSAIRFLANGCRSICRLKLCHNGFSDEAIAAFLEASGESLSELSLNNISKVGFNTALSLAKCSRNLLSLDLSWCRKLTDEALGLIVDSCLSLRLLKIFGCTQITNMFLNGHSNSLVQIIGLKMMPILEHLDVLEPQEAPLRYPPLTFYAN